MYSQHDELLESPACILDKLMNMVATEDASLPSRLHKKIVQSIIDGSVGNAAMHSFRFQLEFILALNHAHDVLTQFVATQEQAIYERCKRQDDEDTVR